MLELILASVAVFIGLIALGAGVSVTDVYDSLLTTTLRNLKGPIQDNIFNSMPTLKYFKRADALEKRDGGHEIAKQVLYGRNTTIKAMSGYEVLDTSPQEGHTIARYPWKEYGGTISISQAEKWKNTGDAAIGSLLEAKVFQAQETLRDSLTTDLFTDATSDPAKRLTPFPLLIDNGATSTVGGLSGTTYTWWQNYQTDVGAFATNLLNLMITGYNTCSRGGSDFPNVIIGSQGAVEYFERLAVQTGNYVRLVRNDNATLELGFEVMKFKSADIFFDSGLATDVPVTGDTLFFVNTKYTKCVVHTHGAIETSDFRPSINQMASVAQVSFFGNFVTWNRRKNGILHGIDAS